MFDGLLFPTRARREAPLQTQAPDCFMDLGLDRLFAPMLEAKKEYRLEPVFYSPQRDPATVAYRQAVLAELEDDELRTLLAETARNLYGLGREMDSIRTAGAQQDAWHGDLLAQGRMLRCAGQYCRAVAAPAERLRENPPQSSGLRGLAEYLSAYCASERFTGLRARVERLTAAFSGVEYCMLIHNGTIRVRKYEDQQDLSRQVLAMFEKFRQGDVKDYRQKIPKQPRAAHVEEAVLRMAARQYRALFADLSDFCTAYAHFDDETLLRFSRDIQFYLAWLELVKPLKKEGLPFTFPTVCDLADHLYARDFFDLALAAHSRGKIVTNDFTLDAPERMIVVTGPNQGGKTTFARAFGQMHYLASLGLSVPGREAALYRFDSVLTHFGRQEDLTLRNGKLQDDLLRLRSLLQQATAHSVIIINEIFSSTTLADALFLGGKMMDALSALKAPAVIVTFLDELAAHGADTVSMMSTVRAEDPALRTYRILRKPPDGLAYALYIAGKHALTYDQLCGRLQK